MTIQEIQMFLQLAEHLNFTEVAKRYYISQPTLSKHISKLEEELGVKLFHRAHHSLTLTTAGIVFRDEMLRINVEIENAIASVRQIDKRADGKLSFGILNLLSPNDINRVIPLDFSERYPKVELEMSLSGYKALRNGANERSFDFLISTAGELASLTSYESRLLWRSNPVIVVKSDSPYAKRTSISLEELKDEYFVVLDQKESTSAVHTLIQACQQRQFYPKISKFASGIPISILYVEMGYGVTVSDQARVAFQVDSRHRVIPISNDDRDLFRAQDVYLAWNRANPNHLVPMFLDYLAQHPPIALP